MSLRVQEGPVFPAGLFPAGVSLTQGTGGELHQESPRLGGSRARRGSGEERGPPSQRLRARSSLRHEQGHGEPAGEEWLREVARGGFLPMQGARVGAGVIPYPPTLVPIEEKGSETPLHPL